MSEFKDLDLPAPPAADGGVASEPEAPNEPRSAMDRIHRRREGFRQERHVDLSIPGYRGDLVARYRAFTYDEGLRINGQVERLRAKQDPHAQLYGHIETLTTTCLGIFVREEGGELSPVDPGGTTVRYDERLAEILKFEPADTAALVVRGTFPSELAIVNHGMELAAWIDDESQEVDDALLGE